MAAHKWFPIIVDGEHNAAVREATKDASGAYAVRETSSRKVVYVGVSTQGVMWKTITRHFNAPRSFAAPKPKGGGNSFATRTPEKFEVTYQVTSRGHRTAEKRDKRAEALEGRWISAFLKRGEPLLNNEVPVSAADDFAFGANVKSNPTYDVVNGRGRVLWTFDAPSLEEAEKRAAARRREEKDAAAWKGARVLRGDVDVEENPGRDLVALGELVSIGYRDKSGRVRFMRFGARSALVAFTPAGRLVLIFAPKVIGPASKAGAAEYKRMHWGRAGRDERLAGERLAGKAPALGPALEITYATRKGGDGAPVDYWHTFGDYGALSLKKAFIPPKVVAAKVGGRLLVRLDGGTYTVSEHGIVG